MHKKNHHSNLTGDRLSAIAQRLRISGDPRRAGERDKYAGSPASTKEVLEIVCKSGAEGIQNFLKGEARQMAKELRIEDCINDLLEREKLDPIREAKVIAAYKEMVEKWDKDMKVIEVESETDEPTSDEGDETPPEEPVVEAEPSEQEAVAEAAISVEMDCLL